MAIFIITANMARCGKGQIPEHITQKNYRIFKQHFPLLVIPFTEI